MMLQCFNPLDRGNLNQITKAFENVLKLDKSFQSPRSGKFESNQGEYYASKIHDVQSFNPLDRGNLNQIVCNGGELDLEKLFQSPRSGKFESNAEVNAIRLLGRGVSIP